MLRNQMLASILWALENDLSFCDLDHESQGCTKMVERVDMTTMNKKTIMRDERAPRDQFIHFR